MSTPRPNLVVMKFGGTSVEDAAAILRTASIVSSRLRKNLNPIVVVSAMSKVTDALLAAAAAAFTPPNPTKVRKPKKAKTAPAKVSPKKNAARQKIAA